MYLPKRLRKAQRAERAEKFYTFFMRAPVDFAPFFQDSG
jgi:hypothetical protein